MECFRAVWHTLVRHFKADTILNYYGQPRIPQGKHQLAQNQHEILTKWHTDLQTTERCSSTKRRQNTMTSHSEKALFPWMPDLQSRNKLCMCFALGQYRSSWHLGLLVLKKIYCVANIHIISDIEHLFSLVRGSLKHLHRKLWTNHEYHWNAKTNLIKPTLISTEQWNLFLVVVFFIFWGVFFFKQLHWNNEKLTMKSSLSSKNHEMPENESLMSKNTHIHFKGPTGSIQLF